MLGTPFVLPVASLIGGFIESNFTGQAIVLAQIFFSIIAVAIFIGKKKELSGINRANKRFLRDFLSGRDVLDYYLQRKSNMKVSLELMYNKTCERMIKLLDPEMRRTVIGSPRAAESIALAGREIGLLRGTCEHAEEDEEIRIEKGMGLLATIVTIAPMLGLLGTVWGVLDAFDLMGGKGTVLLSEIAPAISAALVTTVVGLLVAIPSACGYNFLAGMSRQISADMDGFCDELLGRIACEYQGRED